MKSFRFFKTKKVPSGDHHKSGAVNTRTPWWYVFEIKSVLNHCFIVCFIIIQVQFYTINFRNRDGSVIYGNDETGMRRVRVFKDGKLKISGDGLLERDERGVPISGDIRNSWSGFSLLQALFVKEHNSVCEMLKVSIP